MTGLILQAVKLEDCMPKEHVLNAVLSPYKVNGKAVPVGQIFCMQIPAITLNDTIHNILEGFAF